MFGQGPRNATDNLNNFSTPPSGITKQTLQAYSEIAQRAINAGNDATGVQATRLKIIEKALQYMGKKCE
ncbi:MAG: hypothetical protein ACLQVD_17040 [Capsulimonadaceae bacterium]